MHQRTLSKIEGIKGNINSVKSVQLEEFYQKLKKSVSEATISIDLTLNQSSNPQSGNKHRKEYFKTISSIIKKDKIKVRRITTITSKEKLDLIQEWFLNFDKSSNFHIRYVSISSHGKFNPSTSIQIIDSKILFISGLNTENHAGSVSGSNIIIESNEIGKAFQNYYDMYWNSLEILKEGDNINNILLNKIENDLLKND